jgi:CelD/BcsL family acetyltransferase involved in cellulose biosynthesis
VASSGAFLKAVLHAGAGTGQVWLQGIRLGSQLIAYSVAFRHRETLYGYQQGFHSDYARYGPGRLLQLHIQRAAITAGITRFDLLRGAEPHKQGWTDLADTNYRVVVWSGAVPAVATLRVLAARMRISGRDELRRIAVVRWLARQVRSRLARRGAQHRQRT